MLPSVMLPSVIELSIAVNVTDWFVFQLLGVNIKLDFEIFKRLAWLLVKFNVTFDVGCDFNLNVRVVLDELKSIPIVSLSFILTSIVPDKFL